MKKEEERYKYPLKMLYCCQATGGRRLSSGEGEGGSSEGRSLLPFVHPLSHLLIYIRRFSLPPGKEQGEGEEHLRLSSQTEGGG